jgi:hypothetical protein
MTDSDLRRTCELYSGRGNLDLRAPTLLVAPRIQFLAPSFSNTISRQHCVMVTPMLHCCPCGVDANTDSDDATVSSPSSFTWIWIRFGEFSSPSQPVWCSLWMRQPNNHTRSSTDSGAIPGFDAVRVDRPGDWCLRACVSSLLRCHSPSNPLVFSISGASGCARSVSSLPSLLLLTFVRRGRWPSHCGVLVAQL